MLGNFYCCYGKEALRCCIICNKKKKRGKDRRARNTAPLKTMHNKTGEDVFLSASTNVSQLERCRTSP